MFQAANNSGNSDKCNVCSTKLIVNMCSGSRAIISQTDVDIVIYENMHSCEREDVVKVSVIEEVEEFFRSNCRLTVTEVYHLLFEQKLRFQSLEEDIESLKIFFSDLSKASNLKRKIEKQQNPDGSDFAAVKELSKNDKLPRQGIVIECSDRGMFVIAARWLLTRIQAIVHIVEN